MSIQESRIYVLLLEDLSDLQMFNHEGCNYAVSGILKRASVD